MAAKPTTAPDTNTGTVGAESQAADMVYLGAKKVRRKFTWRPFRDGPEYTKDAVFDFSGCDEKQLLFLAMYGATVKIQAQLREAANLTKDLKVDPKLYEKVDVLQDVVLASSARKDPDAAAILALRRAGASEAVVQAAMADLGAKKAQKK